jgi:hypothetical protein
VPAALGPATAQQVLAAPPFASGAAMATQTPAPLSYASPADPRHQANKNLPSGRAARADRCRRLAARGCGPAAPG